MATTVLQRQVPVPSVPRDRNVLMEPTSFPQQTVQLGSSQHWDNQLVHSVNQGTPAVLEPPPAPSAQLDFTVWIQNFQWHVHLDITASQERLHHVPNVLPDSPAVQIISPQPHVQVAPTPPQDRLPVQLAPLVSHVTQDHPPAAEQDITVPLALAAAFALQAMNAVEVLPPCVPLDITVWRER